jgi:hypothetical protein
MKMEGLKIAGMIIVGLILWAACMYGSYWVVKTLSYSFFYESMVQDTIRELVKPEYLK